MPDKTTDQIRDELGALFAGGTCECCDTMGAMIIDEPTGDAICTYCGCVADKENA